MTTLTHYLPYRAIVLKFPSINWRIIFMLGFAMLAFLLIFYVYEINQLTGGSYLIKSYEKQINTLSAQNRVLEMNFAKTNLLENIREKTSELNFEKTKEVKYIQIASSFLAKAK